MKAVMIQTKQNKLYNFIDPATRFTREKALGLQQEMVDQVFALAFDIPEGCDLIVTTEAINFCGQQEMLPGEYASYIPWDPRQSQEDPLFEKLAALAREKGAWLVAGAYNRRKNRDGAIRCYNSAFVYDRSGMLMAVYDKVHLTPDEGRNLACGETVVTVDTDMGRMGVAICYDMQFQDVCRNLKDMGADFMAVPTWGWESGYGYQRIRETGLPVIAAMAVPYWMDIQGERNPSSLVDGSCRVLAEGSRQIAQVVYGELPGSGSGEI